LKWSSTPALYMSGSIPEAAPHHNFSIDLYREITVCKIFC